MNSTREPMPPCPRCHSASAVQPSHFRTLEWGIALLVLRPYRCRRCCARFWAGPWLRRPRPRLRMDHIRLTPFPE
jgi:hypothetical protein